MDFAEPDGDTPSSAAATQPADGEVVVLGGVAADRRFVSGRRYGADMTVIAEEEQAISHIHGICLKTGPPRRVGVELEWLVRDARDPALPVTAERIAGAVAAFGAGTGKGISTGTGNGAITTLPTSAAPGVLPSGGLLTTEPGGQLELSSLPADSVAECVRATATDLVALRAAAADAGLELAGVGLDPFRPPRRVLNMPRYAAMEAFFDRDGPWGRQMMCGTASVQVCLDAGDESDGPDGYRWRWRLLHTIGPVLVTAFANSPLRDGRRAGWRSARQQVWARMDPGRTRPPLGPGSEDGAPVAGGALGPPDGDPRQAWAAYALDAQVMCVRDPGSEDWSAPPGLTLREWVRAGSAAPSRPPTTEDLAYHLSTLFPPVRPRGHFELRMIDAQPADGWVVPTAVVSALLSDTRAGEAAMAAAARIWDSRVSESDGDGEDPWHRAARLGPADPRIAAASRECFAAARAALARQATPDAILAAVDDFIERYVSKDRCPADDLLKGLS
jgi:ergothioneine biosynthesis glutamate--cysteine ligase EgtA